MLSCPCLFIMVFDSLIDTIYSTSTMRKKSNTIGGWDSIKINVPCQLPCSCQYLRANPK